MVAFFGTSIWLLGILFMFLLVLHSYGIIPIVPKQPAHFYLFSFMPIWLILLFATLIITLYGLQALYKKLRNIRRESNWTIFHPYLFGYGAIVLLSLFFALVVLNIALIPRRHPTSNAYFIPWYVVFAPLHLLVICAAIYFVRKFGRFFYISYYLRKGRKARLFNWWYLVITICMIELNLFFLLLSLSLEFSPVYQDIGYMLLVSSFIPLVLIEMEISGMFFFMLLWDQQYNRFVRLYHLIMYSSALIFGPTAIFCHVLNSMYIFIGMSFILAYSVPWSAAFIFSMMLLFEEQLYF